MIHNVEDKTKKELVEIVKIQMEEYKKLLDVNIELGKRLAAVERERDELKGAYILLDGLKRRIRSAFEYWPDLAMHKDLSVLLNTRPSQQVINKFAIEQQIEGARCYARRLHDVGLVGVWDVFDSVCEQLRQKINGGE